MTWTSISGKYVKFLTYLIVVILINVAGITLFFRWDLTSNKLYSISDASKKVVSTLSEPLTIKVFFTEKLPAPYNTTEQYLRDLLGEYDIYADRFFNYSFYDVSTEEGEISDSARENQKRANNYGIHPQQIQVVEKDEVKFKRAYMGLVIIHGDLIERIPTIATTEGLEYRLTTAIQKVNNKISALQRLSGKINVRLFLSSSLESVAPYIGLRNLPKLAEDVQQIVEKLNQKNYDRLHFEFLNPTEPAQIDEANSKYNIMTLKWPEIPNRQIPAGRGAIGLLMQYQEKSAAVALLKVVQIPILGTQYSLMDMGELEETINANIEALIDINEDLGYLADHGTLPLSGMMSSMQGLQQSPSPMSSFRGLMSQNYAFKDINLNEDGIPQGLNCLVIVRPTENFSDYALYQIDQFLMQGKSLFLALDSFNEVMPTNQQAAAQGATYIPLNTGLEKLLAHYGIRLKKSFVLDENCFKQQMPQRLGGGERPIYFAPLIKKEFINTDLEFMKTIKGLVAIKMSPLELDTERINEQGLKTHTLFASSEKSWEMRGRINLNPLFLQPPAENENTQSYPLAYILEGNFSSYFEGKAVPVKEIKESQDDKDKSQKDAEGTEADKPEAQPETDEQASADITQIIAEGQFVSKGKPAKIYLMASSEMLKDNVLDSRGRGPNTTLIMNVIDYLNNREDIAVMRGKEQRFNPLDDTSASTKTFIKAFIIVGLPLLVFFFGLVIWVRRRSRKKHIQMMFQK
ncbi:MAG: Gldg family protein [Deltaproteobacteria bacterium]|nr:Gldg family protein [Deltaproteobacteria bacterium]